MVSVEAKPQLGRALSNRPPTPGSTLAAAPAGSPPATVPIVPVRPLAPSGLGSACLVAGVLGALLFASGSTATELARAYAYWTAVGLLLSGLLDLGGGLRNLLRVDLLCLAALFFLTLAEFFLPQPLFESWHTVASVEPALRLVAWCIIAIAVGRHFVPPSRVQARWLQFGEIPVGQLVILFFAALALGTLHIWLAIGLNPAAFWEEVTGPRFDVSWGRGRLGNWKALIYELNLLFYVIPPLAALLWHRRAQVAILAQAGVAVGLVMVLLLGFTGGTRNVLAAYLATFLGGYIMGHPKLNFLKAGAVTLAIGVLFLVASHHMLGFRNIGLRAYLEREQAAASAALIGSTDPDQAKSDLSLHVDLNLNAIAVLMDVFPEKYGYLGAEIPWNALIKPIPRALWPGKPEGLSISIEEAMGVQNMTIATTYIGEAYLIGGWLPALLTSLLIGAAAAWWNRLGNHLDSTYAILVYASGLFAFALTMRSLLWTTTALLPTAALVVGHHFFLRPRSKTPPNLPVAEGQKNPPASAPLDYDSATSRQPC